MAQVARNRDSPRTRRWGSAMRGHISEAAATYAAEGFHIVKLLPGTNRPFERNWQLPTNKLNPFQAEEAWARNPAMNLGVVAWPNYWVLDLDGPSAVRWFEALAGQRCSDVSMTITTPGRMGGRHLWWQMPALAETQELRRSMKGCAQAEIKHGRGQQTAMPPSSRLEGRYDFVRGGVESPQPTPRWLMDYIVKVEPISTTPSLSGLADLALHDSEWGRAAAQVVTASVDGICRNMATVRADRNKILFWSANRLLDLGVGDAKLAQLGAAASLTGLDDDEISRTITSAREARR